MIEKTDPQIIKELAREAEGLLANRAFTEAIKTLRQQWFGEMMRADLEDYQVRELRAKLIALEAIPSVLSGMMAAPQLAQGFNVRRTTG